MDATDLGGMSWSESDGCRTSRIDSALRPVALCVWRPRCSVDVDTEDDDDVSSAATAVDGVGCWGVGPWPCVTSGRGDVTTWLRLEPIESEWPFKRKENQIQTKNRVVMITIFRGVLIRE